jgi:hypothetical protein
MLSCPVVIMDVHVVAGSGLAAWKLGVGHLPHPTIWSHRRLSLGEFMELNDGIEGPGLYVISLESCIPFLSKL